MNRSPASNSSGPTTAGTPSACTRLLTQGKKRAALPKAHTEVFATRAEAEAAQARLQAAGGEDLVTSIVPVVVKSPEPRPALLDDLPVMTKRLTQ